MHNEDLFYICGIALAVSAVVVSFAGLRLKNFPGRALPIVILWFVALIGAATTFSVLHAKDEDEAEAAELAVENAKIEAEEAEAEESPAPAETAPAQSVAKGPGGTLQLAAEESALAFDTTKLKSKLGEVTIDLTNPSPIEHDVAIEKDGKEIAGSDLVAEGDTSVTAELGPGTYTFLCTVPGHAEAGMEGTLTVR
jgi:plastocyanin